MNYNKIEMYKNNTIYVKSKTYSFGNDLTKESIDIDDINKALIKNRIADASLKSDLDDDFKNMDVAFMDAVYEDEDTKDESDNRDMKSVSFVSFIKTNNSNNESISSTNKSSILQCNSVFDRMYM